jgi:hypothetical protein
MKNLNNKTFPGKSAGVSLVAVFSILLFVVLGCRGLFNSSNSVTINTSTTPTATPTPTPSPKPTFKKADASKYELPSDEELQEIVKKTLLDFNKAVEKGDFEDFHTTISKSWQKQTTPETFNSSFSQFISQKINVGSISSKDATFSPDPAIDKSRGVKELNVEGKYDTSPLVKFELKYIPEGKEWKLFGISVDTTGK